MPLLPFGEFRPDVSDYEGQATRNILNVLPRGDGYGPLASLQDYTSSLPGPCRGAFYAINPDGSITTFGATATRLYKLNNTNYTWTDVSKGGAAYAALSNSSLWQFVQFNNLVIAVQANVPPQVFDIVSASAFADLGGSPPQAAYVSIVGRFVVLSGLLSFPFRIQWSGLNAVTTWTPGVNSSDSQDFADGGIVRGVAGGESGVVFQDQAIRRMSYIPGSPLIFQIDRIAQDKGLYAPYSLIRAGERVFFYSGQGFQKIEPGGVPQQIGRERVDRTFLLDLDRGALQLFQGVADPRSSRVYWAYKATIGQQGVFNKLLGYDYALDRFFPAAIVGEYIVAISQAGTTLENLDAISASIDALTLTFDAYATSVQPEVGIFSSTHALGLLRGVPLEATLQSGEQGTDGRRIFVGGFRPITDSAVVNGSISYRETTTTPSIASTEVSMNARTGRCDVRKSTRYVRYGARIPAGTTWSFIAGVEPDVMEDGEL
jgi:hypothetical protein